jgi:catechol O-methyltransferase
VKQHAIKGNADSVISAIDKFGWTDSWLMNIGDAKGFYLSNAVTKKQPKYALEVGAFVGYSAVLIGSKLSQDGKLISVEFSEPNAKIARQMVDFAGLSNKVTIVSGTVTTILKQYMNENEIEYFDLVFLDHDKNYYLSDLQYLLNENLIRKGSIIVADNVLVPGAPEYRQFVNSNPRIVTVEHTSHLEYMPSMTDIVTESELVN